MHQPHQTIFLSEDIPSSTMHRGVRGGLQRAYAGLLGFAVQRTIFSQKPDVAVVSAAMLESKGFKDTAGVRFVTANYVGIKSLARAEVPPLVAFHKALVLEYQKFQPDVSSEQLEAISNRVILDGLLEHLARPAENYWRFFTEEKNARELLLLGGHSSHEKIAAQVARSLGWKTRFSRWSFFLGLIAAGKRKLLFRRDGLPPVSHLHAAYKSANATPRPKGGVVFFCVDERRIRRLAETIGRVSQKGIATTLAALNTKREVGKALQELEGRKIPTDSVNHFSPSGFSIEAAEELFQLSLKTWDQLFAEASPLQAHSCRGVPLAPFCQSTFRRAWAKFSVEAELFHRSAVTYLEARAPELVVVSDISLHSMILTRLCRNRGIPVVFYNYNPMLFTVSFWAPLLYEANRSDFIFVANEHMEQMYLTGGGYPADKVKVVGDVFASPISEAESREARSRLRNQLKVTGEEKIVLALSSFVGPDISETQKRQYFRCIARGLKELGKVHLIVKAHPNEEPSVLRNLLAEEGLQPAMVAHTESLRALLVGSDAACIMFSQAGLEVVMCGVPLVIIQDRTLLADYEAWMPYVREKAGVFVDDKASLAEHLGPLLFQESVRSSQLEAARKFAEKFISSRKDDPVEKMAEEIAIIYATKGLAGG